MKNVSLNFKAMPLGEFENFCFDAYSVDPNLKHIERFRFSDDSSVSDFVFEQAFPNGHESYSWIRTKRCPKVRKIDITPLVDEFISFVPTKVDVIRVIFTCDLSDKVWKGIYDYGGSKRKSLSFIPVSRSLFEIHVYQKHCNLLKEYNFGIACEQLY